MSTLECIAEKNEKNTKQLLMCCHTASTNTLFKLGFNVFFGGGGNLFSSIVFHLNSYQKEFPEKCIPVQIQE
jgi:hypothetical protein